MGAQVSSLDVGSALFGKTRRAVLGLLYARPDEPFYLRQITREVQAGQGAVQRELQRLLDAGLLTREARGREIHYRANRACPVFAEVHGLVLKTVGLADVKGDGQGGRCHVRHFQLNSSFPFTRGFVTPAASRGRLVASPRP